MVMPPTGNHRSCFVMKESAAIGGSDASLWQATLIPPGVTRLHFPPAFPRQLPFLLIVPNTCWVKCSCPSPSTPTLDRQFWFSGYGERVAPYYKTIREWGSSGSSYFYIRPRKPNINKINKTTRGWAGWSEFRATLRSRIRPGWYLWYPTINKQRDIGDIGDTGADIGVIRYFL